MKLFCMEQKNIVHVIINSLYDNIDVPFELG